MGDYLSKTARIFGGAVLIVAAVSVINNLTGTKINILRKLDIANRIIMRPNITDITDIFPQRKLRKKAVKFIVIHHEAVCGSAGVMAVNEYHTITNGWRSIAYHYYISKSGRIFQCLDVKRKNASEMGRNSETVSICLQGNFDKEVPERRQYINLLKLCRFLKNKYPAANIVGHNFFAKKTCPGKNIDTDSIAAVVSDLHFIKFLKK